MAVSITVAETLRAVRAGSAQDETDEITRLLAVATQIVEDQPDAPPAIQNEAAVRIVGYLYDQPAAGAINFTNALRNSGAAALLRPYREIGAGLIGGASASTPSGTVPAGSGLPDLPATGFFVLAVDDGELAWLTFPKP